MKARSITAAGLLALGGLFILFVPGMTPYTAAQGTGGTGVVVGPSVKPKSFDGDLRALAEESATSVSPRELVGFALSTRAPGQIEPEGLSGLDPVVQATIGASAMPSPNLTFKGLDFLNWGAGWPPDTNGDVGPNHYIQTVNTSIGIFSKSGPRIAAMTFNKLWSAVSTGTPCNGSNFGDPVVLYDALADRWVITDFAFAITSSGFPKPPFYECIAVSKTGDPVNGGWWFYPVLTDNVDFNDYPKFGVWPDAYYMTANLFDNSGSFAGARVWAFDRTKMLSGQPMVPQYVNRPSYGGLLPANLRGAAPPAGTPAYFASIDAPSTNAIHIWKFHVDFATPANSWFGQSSSDGNAVSILVPAFTEPCNAAQNRACIPEKGVTSGYYVDGLGDRLMAQLQYRKIGSAESLWAVHTVANSSAQGSQTGIRWYQLNVTGGTIAASPVQQGTYKPNDGVFRWMPSLAVDKFGNMAVGYSASSSAIYPAIRYAGRLATDPLNTLGQSETTLFAGTNSQKSGFNRWGDYSAMTIDPTDDCTFWYTNQYFSSSVTQSVTNWQTRIGKFRFPDCGPVGSLPVQETDPLVQYDGWVGVADSNASGGSFRVSSTLNDKVTLAFTGTSVKWVYVTGPDEGNAKVMIDGVNKGTVSLYSASKQYGVSKTFSGLASASHTIAVQVLGNHAVGSTGNNVVVDAFVVGSTKTEDTAKSIKYNTWIGVSNQAASGGTFRYSNTLNDTAIFAFTGTGVQWLTVKGVGYGKAEVFLDNVDKGTVDLYSPTVQYQFPITFSGLSAGTHTLKILVLHTKNPASSGYKVAVDDFLVTP